MVLLQATHYWRVVSPLVEVDVVHVASSSQPIPAGYDPPDLQKLVEKLCFNRDFRHAYNQLFPDLADMDTFGEPDYDYVGPVDEAADQQAERAEDIPPT